MTKFALIFAVIAIVAEVFGVADLASQATGMSNGALLGWGCAAVACAELLAWAGRQSSVHRGARALTTK